MELGIRWTSVGCGMRDNNDERLGLFLQSGDVLRTVVAT